jgi:hypothetical protein
MTASMTENARCIERNETLKRGIDSLGCKIACIATSTSFCYLARPSTESSGAVFFPERRATRLHRQVCGQFPPPRVLRRRKRGFAVNVAGEWFHTSLSGHLSELLLDPSSRMLGLLKVERVRTLLEQHRAKRQDNHKLIFRLAFLEQWLRSGWVGHSRTLVRA